MNTTGTMAAALNGTLLQRIVVLCGIPIVLIAVLDFLPVHVLPGSGTAIVIVLATFAFLVVHGSESLGWRNLAIFFVMVYAISFFSEALGVATGMVFGDYYYSGALGPKILGVPPLVQLAYIAVSYCSMMIARVLVDARRPTSNNWFAAVVVGSLLMVGWDVSMDPYQSTVAGAWIWRHGGAYFGVPAIHNYAGWFVTVFAFMLVYALVARRLPEAAPAPQVDTSRSFWNLPVLLYFTMALNVILTPVFGHLTGPVASPQNYALPLENMEWSLALICTFVMIVPVVVALLRPRAAPSID